MSERERQLEMALRASMAVLQRYISDDEDVQILPEEVYDVLELATVALRTKEKVNA